MIHEDRRAPDLFTRHQLHNSLTPTQMVAVLVSFREHLLGVRAWVVRAGAGYLAQSPRPSVCVFRRPSNSPPEGLHLWCIKSHREELGESDHVYRTG